MAYRKEFTAEERAAYNEKKQAEMESMIKRIDEGVKAVFESKQYKEYLKFASKFTNYSANNTILISLQKPDATLVAAYGKWKQLGRQVEKGEKGISIFAPVPYNTDQVIVSERPAKDEFGNQLYNDDGTEKTETVEDPLKGIAYKQVYVFDVSQTSGKELPSPVTELSGDIDPAKKEAVFAALKKVTGIDIEFKDIQGDAKGYYSAAKNQIVIKSGMSDAQTLKTAFHETAHNLLHDPEKKIVTAKSPRNEKEVQAESVAFIVAEKFGIDTSEYSFPYIASWSDGKQLEQLKRSLQEIQEAAKKISAEIESELLKMQKRDLSIDEKMTDDELNNIQKAEFLIEDCSDRGVKFSKEDTDKIFDYAGEHEDIGETVKLVADMEEIQRQRDSYGYDFTYMTPIDTKEEALAAFDKGEAVFLLYPDNTEGQALDRSDIENFDGYFGIEKEGVDVSREQNSELVPVSKDTALEMWDKDLDVYIDGVKVENRDEIVNALDNEKICLSEYQYSAQLEFDNPKIENVPAVEKNIIGNTPYKDLGDKSELKYYTGLKNRHAENVAKQLDKDGVKFSGLKKGTVTTITINKADIPRYEAAIEKVKAMYDKNKSNRAPVINKPASVAEAMDKAISDNNYELYRYDLKKAADSVIKEFGAEQVGRVLAEYVNHRGYDGRISSKNKAWAKEFALPQSKYPPTFKTHPIVMDGFIEEARLQISAVKIKLPSYYDDKFLYSSERVELHDDHRGIPETKYYNSSANEYYIPEKGWLDNAAYDRELKISDLSAQDFYAQVTEINANYIDSNGVIGQADMSRAEYTAMTDKTYSPENAEKVEAAKAKLQERMRKAGITEKPVEYYAVRQVKDRSLEVCSMGADGVITTVKPNIATVVEAKKAMLEIFESKKNTVKCEFVHPQTMTEKSEEILRNTPVKSNYEIYQLKSGDENRDIRFEPLKQLAERGIKPDFNNYDKVYEGSISGGAVDEKLDDLFRKFNIERPEDFKGHSMSVSDVVVMDSKAYYVDSVGFQPLKDFKPSEGKIEQEKVADVPEQDKPKPQKKPKL